MHLGMGRPEVRAVALALAFGLVACSRETPQAQPAPPAAAPAPPPKGTLALGEPIASPFVPLAEIAKSPAKYQKHVVTTGGDRRGPPRARAGHGAPGQHGGVRGLARTVRRSGREGGARCDGRRARPGVFESLAPHTRQRSPASSPDVSTWTSLRTCSSISTGYFFRSSSRSSSWRALILSCASRTRIARSASAKVRS
jgi:hypothetical protein